MKEIYIGAAYYPELWDESEIEKDIARCKDLGLNVLRISEFAWSKMEPKEGEFDFGWLKKTVDKLYENGISTVMCTPTCTPPRYLLNKYEEMRYVDYDGKRVDVSSRCHVCKTSPVAREKNRLIVTKMAEALRGHKGIIGWQIDNEIWPYYNGCYCPLCKQAFRDYLMRKYGTADNLNKRWGMSRWSLEYEDFNAVEPPYPDQWKHPSLSAEWWNFQCEQIVSYVNEQADILHAYGYKNVGTDMMMHNDLSYYKVNEKLDVAQFNHYDTAKDLPFTAFSYDFLRCIKDKPFWVTETQVGWNGGEYANCGYRPEGNCYANTWLPVALGAEMNMYWLFRAHPNGHELGHGALYSAAGRQYRVSDEVKRAASDFEKCADFLNSTKIESKIALHYSSAAFNSFAVAPIIKDMHYRNMLSRTYHPIFSHYNLDVIDLPHSLDGYDVVISPFVAVADTEGFKQRIIKWIEGGGTWIVGPMTDIMDDAVSRYTSSPFGFLEELAGVYTKYQKPVANDVFKAQWSDGTECKIGELFDAFEPQKGTESLAKYSCGEFEGLSVITQRKVGKGKVILVGSVIDGASLLRLVGKEEIAKASPNINLTARSGKQSGIIAVETHGESGFVVLDGEYTEAISGKKVHGKVEIEPYSVHVFKAV